MLSISRKYATKAILPEQMEDFILDAAISIKNNKESTENVLKSLTENIKNSVKNNLVVLPVSGIILETSFKIGIFDLHPKKAFVETNIFPNEDTKRIFEKGFENVSSLAVGNFVCHPKSAKKIARSQLVFELSRFKAFIPLLVRNIKHWIFPLKTDMSLFDCSYVYHTLF